jgi:hypothetical protein
MKSMSGIDDLTPAELRAIIKLMEKRISELEERFGWLENKVYELDSELERDRPRDYD